MKTKTLSIGLGLLSISALFTTASAAVLTVDNNPGGLAMYQTFVAAYKAAQPGDTLLFAGSATPYTVDALPIVKRLNLRGPGYFLAENNIPGIQKKSATLSPPSNATVLFTSDETTGSASGSTITGLEFGGNVATSVSITIDRCLANGSLSDNTGGVQFPARAGNLNIRRTFCRHAVYIKNPGSVIMNSHVLLSLEMGPGVTGRNCVIDYLGGLVMDELASISNSIIGPIAGQDIPTAADFLSKAKGNIGYCMCIGANLLPAGNGNINGVARIADVFTTDIADGSYAPSLYDVYFKLKPGSPAIGAGFNGVDMGIFGGTAPYILSGVAGMPRITGLIVPPLADNASGLRFEVSAQSF